MAKTKLPKVRAPKENDPEVRRERKDVKKRLQKRKEAAARKEAYKAKRKRERRALIAAGDNSNTTLLEDQ